MPADNVINNTNIILSVLFKIQLLHDHHHVHVFKENKYKKKT